MVPPWTVAAGLLLCVANAMAADTTQEPPTPRALPTKVGAWKGDFDGMVQRRLIRFLVPFSRTFYFNDKGRPHGLTADYAQDFERYINRKYAKELGKRPITVVIIPITRDKLLRNVADGFGDIAAGDLTVTDERKKIVDFYVPEHEPALSEVVLTGPKSSPIATADDLSGKTVHVRKSSSFYESLVALNDRFKKEGKPPAQLVTVPEALEDEDLMEMLNTGLLQAIVVDDILAKPWAKVFPQIRVNEGAVLRAGGQLGWAIRKDSPKLGEALGDFYRNAVWNIKLSATRTAQYARNIEQLKDPSKSADYKRFQDTIALFEKYGKEYEFDPLMLAAQGYQESQLNQNAHSAVGAVGIMQVMPATGAELKVGDIHVAEANVHAGAKYMDQLMRRYFPDAKFSEEDRTLFAFASYNAGAGSIARMRREAEKRGLDPNRWFNNVEIVTAEHIGSETTTYVRNIYKYYAAYKLMLEAQAEKERAHAVVH